MLTIFTRVKAVFDNEYSKERKSFQKGFRTCYELFRIGYERTPLYSYEDDYYRSQHELEAANHESSQLRKRLETQVELTKSLSEQLLKAKEELMQNKSDLKEQKNELVRTVRELDFKAAQLNELLAVAPFTPEFAKRSTANKIATIISSTFTTPEDKIKRLKDIFRSSYDLTPNERAKRIKKEVKTKWKAKKANTEKVDKFIEKEATKAENNIGV